MKILKKYKINSKLGKFFKVKIPLDKVLQTRHLIKKLQEELKASNKSLNDFKMIAAFESKMMRDSIGRKDQVRIIPDIDRKDVFVVKILPYTDSGTSQDGWYPHNSVESENTLDEKSKSPMLSIAMALHQYNKNSGENK